MKKMYKRIISFALAILMIAGTLSGFPVTAKAASLPKAVFGVGKRNASTQKVTLVDSSQFNDLFAAINYAEDKKADTVVLLQSGQISGSYTIPKGITLLIPFDEEYSCYKEEPDKTPNEYEEPKAYRTLTMAKGSSLTVANGGAISVSAMNAAGAGSTNYAGSPTGFYGHIDMESDSRIIVNGGASLFAWGFITGKGEVQAKFTAKIYENMQIADFRGGSATTEAVGFGGKIPGSVFPFSQYYVQNIEVKLILEYGAEEYVRASVTISGMPFSATIKFIAAKDAMFIPEEGGYVTKYYDSSRDRMMLDAYGDMTLNGIYAEIGAGAFLIPVDSSNFVLPISSHLSIHVHEGTMRVKQDALMMPGSEVMVDNGCVLEINEGNKIYVYDVDQWRAEYLHPYFMVKPVVYSPTRTFDRTKEPLKDAYIDLNGTLTGKGTCYTTTGGAQIVSTKGTGSIEMTGNAGTETETYQLIQYRDAGSNKEQIRFEEIPITSLKLQNQDGSYTATAGAKAGDVYYYNNNQQKWMAAKDVAITFDKNDGSNEKTVQNITKADILANNKAGGKGITLLTPFTRELHTLKEWNTKADGTGTAYAEGQNIFFTENTTLYAIWEPLKTVTWKHENGTALEIDQGVEYGEKPEYNGAVPVKEANAQYTYTFAGWMPAITEDTIVTEDITYTAQFSSTVNKYTVTWTDDAGKIIEIDNEVPYGTMAEYNGATPYKAPNDRAMYTFTGWDEEISNVTRDVTYKAQFEEKVRTYTITWLNGNGEVIRQEKNLEHGTVISVPANPTCKEDNQFVYGDFIAWDLVSGNAVIVDNKVKVTDDVTYKARYNTTTKTYTVKFVGPMADGSAGTYEYARYTYKYGETPSYQAKAPSKAPTLQYTYTWKGWNPAISPVTGDITYEALFEETINNYTVIWRYANGTVLATESVPYGTIPQYKGETPVKAATQNKVSKFVGWDKEIVPVTSDIEYVAIFEDSTREYNVTWMNGDEILAVTKAPFRSVPVYSGETPVKLPIAQYSYVFSGWDAPAVITGDAICYAVFDEIVNKYDVIWQLDDGTVLGTDKVEYGKTPSYDGTPAKAPTTRVEYTFKEWNAEFVPVTGNVTYIAYFDEKAIDPYTITYLGADGEELLVQEVYAGEATELPYLFPTREGHTFKGWDKELPLLMPKENLVLNAVWDINTYTVVWKNEDGTVLETDENVKYGTEPVYNGETPEKEGTVDIEYVFSGWDPVISPVTKDVTYTAKFTANEKGKHTVTFKDGFGNTLHVFSFYAGESLKDVTVPDPTKEGYTFVAWNSSLPDVMGEEDIVITAVFQVNTYTVTWLAEDGTVLEVDEKVVHGMSADYDRPVPTKEGNASTEYIFAGWTPAPGAVTADTTYTAVFTAQEKAKYTVTYKDGDKALLTEEYYKGQIPVFAETLKPEKEGYTFIGWNKELPDTMAENVVLEAQWKVNQYTITFLAEGGSFENAVDQNQIVLTQDYASEIITPVAPVRAGYVFAGWTPSVPENMPAENLTFKAQWTKDFFTITFDTGVEGITVDNMELEFEADITAPDAPERTGYTFLGWEPALPEKMPAGDMTVHAQWKINQYTITFDTQGGSEIPAIEADFDAKVTEPVAPVKEGYIFAGWDKSFPEKMPVNGLTLTAQWVVKTYAVKWDTNGDGEAEETVMLNHGVMPEHADPVIPADGKYNYTFKEWNPAPVEVTKDAVYTAVFDKTPINYIITFVTNGGTEIAPMTVPYGEVIGTIENPTREGYIFDGWNMELPETMPAEDITLFAYWIADSYILTFDTAGGSVIDAVEYEFGKNITVPADPTREGYTFAGWDKEIPAKMPAENVTITALWTPIDYTITFDSNGGTRVEAITAPYESVVSTPDAPTREGYNFVGWDPAFPTSMPFGGVKLTAKWQPKMFDISWDIDGDGTVDETTKAAYDSMPVHADGVKAADPEYTYVFDGWTPQLSVVKENAAYKALFKKVENEYKITFDSNGGSKVETLTVSYNSKVEVPADPIREGYTFLGWEPALPEIMPAKDVNVKALWAINTYMITFDTDGGSAAAPHNVVFGEATPDISKMKVPTKTGYTFTGWDKTLPETMPAENITLKAQWKVNQYTITFDTDGGSKVAPITQDFGSKVTAPKAPTKEHYTFAGWDKEIPETMPAENVTIKATWTYAYTGWMEKDGGKTYLKDGKVAYYDQWQTIEGKTYYFDREGMIATGMFETSAQTGGYTATFIFDENGVFQSGLNGIYVSGKDTYWVTNGAVDVEAGFVRNVTKDGEVNYYYFNSEGKAVKNKTLELSDAQLKEYLPAGSYTFGADGVIPHDADTSKNNIVKEADGYYYYIDGIKIPMGLFLFEGDYYYADNNGKLYTKTTKKISKLNGLPLQATYYTFDSRGRIIVDKSKHDVIRVFGNDRFATSYAIADAYKKELGVDKFSTVVVASGLNFADALAGSYLAAVKEAPILLAFNHSTYIKGLHDYINANLAKGGTVYVLGGESAVPANIVDSLKGTYKVTRLGGAHRFDTNLLILKEAGVTNEDILIATGMNFADSLSASAAARPILLVGSSLLKEQKDFLAAHKGNDLYVLGGESAVSKKLETEVKAYGTVKRIGGASRFETSVMIAEEFFKDAENAVLAYAMNFPDGLCAGPLAVGMNAPLILTATKWETEANEFVTDEYIKSGAVIGGTGLISDDAVRKIFDLSDDAVIKSSK